MAKKSIHFKKSIQHKNLGHQKAVEGLNYVTDIMNQLNHWKTYRSVVAKNLLEYLKLNINDVSQINTKHERELGKLSSHGACKTDLVIEVTLKDYSVKKICVNVKKTSNKKSSFHEYSALEFIKVLRIRNPEVKRLIFKHQNDGSAKLFTQSDIKVMSEYFRKATNLDKLRKWVLLGIGGVGIGDQIANCILKNDHFYDYDSYVARFLNSSKAGFGTGFSWTRQSKGRKKTIQLKG